MPIPEPTILRQAQILSADGAVDPKKAGMVFITKATAAALTLAAPSAGVDDGIMLAFISTTAAAHTVTNASPGFNNLGASGDVATFGGAKGDSFKVIAYNGNWWTLGSPRNVTIA